MESMTAFHQRNKRGISRRSLIMKVSDVKRDCKTKTFLFLFFFDFFAPYRSS